MGQLMPGVVFFVSMTVLFLTILFLIRYVRRSAMIAGELESLQKTLGKMGSTPGEWAKTDAWEKIRANLIAAGKQAPPLSEFAKQIQSEIVPLPSDPTGRVAPKKAISELAAEIMRNERWSGQSLAEALPGWLTAIGLLTTFLAILLGLQGVKVLTNLEVRGIGGLVNGLSGKFFSSIIALGCAISITIAHYFISGSLRLRWNSLVERLQELVPHLSVERIFLEMVAVRKNDR